MSLGVVSNPSGVHTPFWVYAMGVLVLQERTPISGCSIWDSPQVASGCLVCSSQTGTFNGLEGIGC